SSTIARERSHSVLLKRAPNSSACSGSSSADISRTSASKSARFGSITNLASACVGAKNELGNRARRDGDLCRSERSFDLINFSQLCHAHTSVPRCSADTVPHRLHLGALRQRRSSGGGGRVGRQRPKRRIARSILSASCSASRSVGAYARSPQSAYPHWAGRAGACRFRRC